MNSECFHEMICSVCCGAKDGTGFLLKDDLIITATHVISYYCDTEQIQIRFLGRDKDVLTAVPITQNWAAEDIVILRLEMSPKSTLKPILAGQDAKIGQRLEAYSYLGMGTALVECDFVVSVIQKVDDELESCNLQLKPSAEERINDFAGMSGAPLAYRRLHCRCIDTAGRS